MTRVRDRLMRFVDRPAGRGTSIVHEVDESHPNTQSCDICRLLDAAEVLGDRLAVVEGAASTLVALGNQPGLDDEEWEAAFTAMEEALR